MNRGIDLNWRSKDGLSVHGRAWPRENSRATIVLVPGTGDHIGRFIWLANRLNEKGFAVFGADWRGNGLSDGPRGFIGSVHLVRQDLTQTIEEAGKRNSGPVFLYGQSFGGLLAIDHVLQRSSPWHDKAIGVRGLVASSPALGLAIEPPAWKLAIGHSLGKCLPKLSLATGIRAEHLTRDTEAQAEFRRDALRHSQICAGTFFGMRKIQHEVMRQADRLMVPSLLMHGDADEVTDCQATQKFAQACPERCTFKSWLGMRHELHHEVEKNLVVDCVVEWLGKQLRDVGDDS